MLTVAIYRLLYYSALQWLLLSRYGQTLGLFFYRHALISWDISPSLSCLQGLLAVLALYPVWSCHGDILANRIWAIKRISHFKVWPRCFGVMTDLCRELRKKHLFIEDDNDRCDNDQHYCLYAFCDLPHLQHSLKINDAVAENCRYNAAAVLIP